MTDWSKWKFRRGGTESGNQEKHGGDDQSALATDTGANPSAGDAANDAADERAGIDDAP